MFSFYSSDAMGPRFGFANDMEALDDKEEAQLRPLRCCALEGRTTTWTQIASSSLFARCTDAARRGLKLPRCCCALEGRTATWTQIASSLFARRTDAARRGLKLRPRRCLRAAPISPDVDSNCLVVDRLPSYERSE